MKDKRGLLRRKRKQRFTDKEVAKFIPENLTAKQAMFLQEYFKTGNGTRSALKVYDTDDYSIAGSIAHENLEKLREPIKTFMEAKGLTMGRVVKVVNDATKATRKYAKINGRDESGKPTYEYVDEPNHEIRLKAADIAGKWLGLEPTTQVQAGTQINQFNFGDASKELVDRFTKFLKASSSATLEK